MVVKEVLGDVMLRSTDILPRICTGRRSGVMGCLFIGWNAAVVVRGVVLAYNDEDEANTDE